MLPIKNPMPARRMRQRGIGNGGGLGMKKGTIVWWFVLVVWLGGGAQAIRADEHPSPSSAGGSGFNTVPEPTTLWRVELFSKRRTLLSSEMAARITKIAPREGRRFEKGDLLVSLDCAMEMAQMQRARAILDAAEAKSQVNARLSRLQATSKLEERVAQAEMAQARAELAIIQVKIDHCQIHAPFSGRVISLSAQEHQYVKAGDPLMEILDEQSLEVVFLLPSRQLPQRAVGERFHVTIEETQRSYPAQIVAFGALIDSVSQSVKVFGAIDGRFPDLLPGMSGTAQLATRESETLPARSPP